MEKSMLKKEDKIFKNLYNELGWEIDKSILRDDWKNTKDLISKGREWIINEIKISELRERAETALGENFDIREFHNIILQKGTLTLPLMEEEVMAYIKQTLNE